MKWFAIVVALVAVCVSSEAETEEATPYVAPTCDECVFLETFSEMSWEQSSDAKYNGEVEITDRSKKTLPGDSALVLPTSHRFYGIAKAFDSPIDNKEKTFVLQYEVLLREKLDCGGAYMKLVTASEDFEPTLLKDDTPYSIMFGPDRCGPTNNKVHVIFRHQNKKTGEIEEKHLKNPPNFTYDDRTSHLYTLVVSPDNTYELRIDGEIQKSGSMFEDFEPPFQPAETIPDPDDEKPEDWVDDAEIPDATAVKPDDWDEDAPMMIDDMSAEKPSGWMDDEPELIPDESASRPDDWDDEEDGEFEAPMIRNPNCKVGCGEWQRPQIRNPEYKGKWSPPMVENPEYKGEWAPREIPNPAYYEETSPSEFAPIGALAYELWVTNKDIVFDNILIARDYEVAREYAEKTWRIHHEVEKADRLEEKSSSESVFQLLQTFVETNPIVVAAIGVALVLPMIFLCRGSSAPEPVPAAHKRDDDTHVPQDDDSEGDEGCEEIIADDEDAAVPEERKEEEDVEPEPVAEKSTTRSRKAPKKRKD